MIGIIGDGLAHHLESLVRLGINHGSIFGGAATGEADNATGCNKRRNDASNFHGHLLLRKFFLVDYISIWHRLNACYYLL